MRRLTQVVLAAAQLGVRRGQEAHQGVTHGLSLTLYVTHAKILYDTTHLFRTLSSVVIFVRRVACGEFDEAAADRQCPVAVQNECVPEVPTRFEGLPAEGMCVSRGFQEGQEVFRRRINDGATRSVQK